jgi:uncharacterized protein (TIGR02302 family)
LRLALTWLAMTWERLAAALWPTLTLILFALALALTDVLPALPGLIHLGLLLVFVGAVVALGWRGLRTFRWPSRTETRARLETASPVVHRPLTASEDTLPVTATPLQRAIWKRHQTLARAALNRLRNPWPSPDVARLDSFAVRAIAVLLLAIALVGTGRDAPHRLARALAPAFGEGNAPVTVKLWITPPAYTGRTPIYLESPAATHIATIEVPAGSKALAVVDGTRRKTDMALVASDGTKAFPLAPVATTEDSTDTSRRVETELSAARRLEIRQGPRVLAGWDVNWIPDQPPTIAIPEPARDIGRGRLRITYAAHDDYGLQAVTGHITRPDTEGSIDINLSLPPFSPKETTHSSVHDLGGQPWAGMKVQLTLTATDQAGQSATTPPMDITLPERSFTHPVAKEIVRLRKDLMADPDRNAVPARDALSEVMAHPHAFNDDRVVFLALATAKYRLTYESGDEAMNGVPELLWQTAVRIEDGTMGEVEQHLDAAERALQDAMERNAPPEEVSKLIDELQRSFAEYMRSMLDRAPDQTLDMSGIDAQGNLVAPEDVAAMMEQLRQLSRMGAQDAARQMLANLQNMLQSMRDVGNGNADNADMKAAQQMMQDMHGLTERQSQLLNESFDHLRQEALQGKQEGGNQKAGGTAAQKQQKLRQDLDTLMGQMSKMTGDKPGSVNDATGAMQQAEDALQAGSWRQGAEHQGDALSKMQSAMQEASQQMMQSLAKKGMSGFVRMPGMPHRLDALGPRNGLDDGSEVRVPNGPDAEGMAQRVRTILDEIRRRASDRTRPAEEQQYLRRLMKEF